MAIQTGQQRWATGRGGGHHRSQFPAFVSLALGFLLAGCAVRTAPAPARIPLRPADSGFIDLEPGWRLRVVTPILKSGGYRLDPGETQTRVSGNNVSLTAPGFLGYEVAYYTVAPRGAPRFVSAEVTRDGQIAAQPRPLVRLFQVPRGARYMRLIYLLRVSAADHDMAMAAARTMPDLEALTRRVMTDPTGGCRSTPRVVCTWIPAGIAVVPQVRQIRDGAEDWVPAR